MLHPLFTFKSLRLGPLEVLPSLPALHKITLSAITNKPKNTYGSNWWKYISCSCKVQKGPSGLAGRPPLSRGWHPGPFHPTIPPPPAPASLGTRGKSHRSRHQRPLRARPPSSASPHCIGWNPVTWPWGLPREAGMGRELSPIPAPLTLIFCLPHHYWLPVKAESAVQRTSAASLTSLDRRDMRCPLQVTSKDMGVALLRSMLRPRGLLSAGTSSQVRAGGISSFIDRPCPTASFYVYFPSDSVSQRPALSPLGCWSPFPVHFTPLCSAFTHLADTG